MKTTMKETVRRSNLMVPITEAPLSPLIGWSAEGEGPGADRVSGHRSTREGWRHIPDAVTLDLEDGIPRSKKIEARLMIKDAIPEAGRGSTEVFVRVNNPYLFADLEASVWPGLTGVVLPKVECGDDVSQASKLMEDLERERGIELGSLELVVLVESALGVWNVREIVAASPRVSQVALGECEMCRSLGITPSEEHDPFVYARGRIVIEGTAAGVQPVGMAHPLGSVPRVAPPDELLRLSAVTKDLGFKGVICPHPSWVEPVNAAFTPTTELVQYYTQVREVFAQAVAAGTAAVPFAGRMIDVPVDEWAKVVLRMAALCKNRDEKKRRAWEER